MKNDNIPEEIKARVDIVDLIGQYVDLKRAGQNYKGLCPFHSEKTPSFMVNPSRQVFHCFGCNKGGDIFAFIMERENMSFQEALTSLAEKAGVSLERTPGVHPKKGEKDALLSLQKAACVFFRNALGSSQKARGYLRERGLSEGMLEGFEIGFAGGGRDTLYRHLKSSGYEEGLIRKSGLVYFGDKGPFDFFRERIMFPIHDLQGRIVAFGGRTLQASKDIAKYINSPESELFHKSETVYGLHRAKQAILDRGYCLITEGYLDTIVCHQFGFSHAIAPLGTALTGGHLRKLKRYSAKAVLVFDGDNAGVSAARRALETAFREGFTVKIALVPEGEDPDTMLRRQGEMAFRKCVGSALSPVDFLMRLHKRNALDGARAVLQLLAICPDGLMRDEALRELTEQSRIHEATLRQELKTAIQKAVGNKTQTGQAPAQTLHSASKHPEERVLLGIALAVPSRRAGVLEKLETESIEDAIIKDIFEKLRALSAQGRDAESNEDLLALCSSEERGVITRLLVETVVDEENVDKCLEDCFRRLGENARKRQIAEAAQDTAMLKKLLDEKNRLQKS